MLLTTPVIETDEREGHSLKQSIRFKAFERFNAPTEANEEHLLNTSAKIMSTDVLILILGKLFNEIQSPQVAWNLMQIEVLIKGKFIRPEQLSQV
jgi:hypothetical protein